MQNNHNNHAGTALLTLGAGLPLSVFLSISPQAEAQASSDSLDTKAVLEEVEVSARRRQESLQQVPVAVSTIDAKTIEQMGLGSLDEFSSVVPNLSFDFTSPLSGSSNAASVYIRGVGQSDYILTSDPGVGIYLDGVYLGRSPGSVLDMVDIERVEVLRGPQGNLYGKNTLGGAIKLYTEPPAQESAGAIEFTLGSDARRNIKLSGDLPLLEDTLLSHFALVSRHQDGYIRRTSDGADLGNENSTTFRGSLLWQPHVDFQAIARFDHSRVREHAAAVGFAAHSADQLAENIAASPLTSLYNLLVGPNNTLVGWGDQVLYDERFYSGSLSSTHASGSHHSDLDATGASLEFYWQTGTLDITSLTAYRRTDSDFGRDPDHSPLVIIDTRDSIDHYQVSQELQLSGSLKGSRLQWLAGIYLFEEKGCNGVEALLMPDLPGLAISGDYNVHNHSGALYAHANYGLNSRWSVSVGLRQTYEKKRYRSSLKDDFSGVVFLPPDESERSFTDTAPSLSLQYRANPHLFLYGSVGSGFKSGGFDGRYSAPQPAPTSYDPERLITYEMGLKSEWLDRRLRLNAAMFYTDYKDMQFDRFEGIVQVTRNAAESRIQGAELELTAALSVSLKAFMSLGYIDSDYKRVDADTGIEPSDLFVNTPQWSLFSGLEYRLPTNLLGQFTWRVDYSWRDIVANDALNTPALIATNVHKFNTSLHYEPANHSFSVKLYGHNLTDQQAIVSGSSFLEPLGFVETVYDAPREVGVNIAFQF